MIGTSVSHYRIHEKLGSGGMGVVYKAEDTKLKRTVALKFLPPEVTRHDESRERFITEAQAASALDHPNICNIHEINQSDDGHLYICMAFYDGETLQERLERGPLPLAQALTLAIQITQGIIKAHETGIIHRDIKPANIMITGDETVKLLDFGLAKLTGQTGITLTGTTLGTTTYMSPEQARGTKVDQLTDIWAIGVLLYQMITGRPPFRGELGTAVIYAILNENPEPITGLRSGIPLELERIVLKCLEKKPRDRFQTAADLQTDLRRLQRDLESSPTQMLSSSTFNALGLSRHWLRQWRTTAVTAVCALLLGAAGVIGWQHLVAPDLIAGNAGEVRSAGEQVFIPLTGSGGMAAFPSWSPDGEWISYASDEAGNMEIFKRPVSGGPAQQLTITPATETFPSWSPDGMTIACSSDQGGGTLQLIPADGGSPHQLVNAEGVPILGSGPIWSPDGRVLAYHSLGDIFVVPYSGGTPERVVAGTGGVPYMVWGPQGRHLIYWNRARGDIQLTALDQGPATSLGLIPSGDEVVGLTWSADGSRLLYARGPFGGNKTLWLATLDPDTFQVTSSAQLTNPLTDVNHCVLSPDGRQVAFTLSRIERHLLAFPRDPASGLITGEASQITTRGGRNYYPAISPDGRLVAWTSHRYAKGVLYFRDLVTGDRARKLSRDWSRSVRETTISFAGDGERVVFSTTAHGSYELCWMPSLDSVAIWSTETRHPIRDVGPAWSPVRDEIAFYSNREGSFDIWTRATTGNQPARRLTDWQGNETYPTWSPDGQLIAFRSDRDNNADIWVMAADGSDPRPMVTHPAEEGWAAWSPDGRWFYFTSNRNGSFNLWVMPATGGEPRPVTTYRGMTQSLPEAALYTRFAIAEQLIILPLEQRSGEIFLLEAGE